MTRIMMMLEADRVSDKRTNWQRQLERLLVLETAKRRQKGLLPRDA
jgi:hypothetical protein